MSISDFLCEPTLTLYIVHVVFRDHESKDISIRCPVFLSLNSGDHDMVVSYFNTLNWIKLLNLSVENDWRPWFVDKQVAGVGLRIRSGLSLRERPDPGL
ncbi:hypothetical protein OSB04_030954 [Centaurea solstitialis]|uniref:Uncharacterized protein n=1 Tax=Centaurea solstitialis TaxID=347529 RepID=A0AA38W7N1_9ASTR|nr:hypothetical protein OSB04_030954 [Centaurea solstitialis]